MQQPPSTAGVRRSILFSLCKYGTTQQATAIFSDGSFGDHRCVAMNAIRVQRFSDLEWIEIGTFSFEDCRAFVMPSNVVRFAHELTSMAHGYRYPIAARACQQFLGYCQSPPALTPLQFLGPLMEEFYDNHVVPNSMVYMERLDGSVQRCTQKQSVVRTIEDVQEMVKRWDPSAFVQNEGTFYKGVNHRECSDEEDSQGVDSCEDENDMPELSAAATKKDKKRLREIKNVEVLAAPIVDQPVVKAANPDPSSFPDTPLVAQVAPPVAPASAPVAPASPVAKTAAPANPASSRKLANPVARKALQTSAAQREGSQLRGAAASVNAKLNDAGDGSSSAKRTRSTAPVNPLPRHKTGLLSLK